MCRVLTRCLSHNYQDPDLMSLNNVKVKIFDIFDMVPFSIDLVQCAIDHCCGKELLIMIS